MSGGKATLEQNPNLRRQHREGWSNRAGAQRPGFDVRETPVSNILVQLGGVAVAAPTAHKGVNAFHQQQEYRHAKREVIVRGFTIDFAEILILQLRRCELGFSDRASVTQ